MNIETFLKKFFCGQFILERKAFPQNLQCTGKGVFTNFSENIINYEESGYCNSPNRQHSFHQKRVFRIENDGFYIDTLENTVLHHFKLDNIQAFFPIKLKHTHFCKDDIYQVEINLMNFERFTMLYTVKGPKKNYHTNTVFNRLIYT